MSQPRVRLIAAVGLLLAVAGSALIPVAYQAAHSEGLLNSYLIEVSIAASTVPVLSGALAGVLSLQGLRLLALARIGVAALVAASATAFALGSVGLVVSGVAVPAVYCPDGCPGALDSTSIFVAVGVLLYLVPAIVYEVSAPAQGVSRPMRVVRLLLLLLALIPFANIVGFIGFLWLEARESAPPLVAAGQSARQSA